MQGRSLTVLLVALALALTACTVSIKQEPTKASPADPTVGELCKAANSHQQLAAEFEPDTRRDRLPAMAALLEVGTLKDGLCLAIATEEQNRVWEVKRVTLIASPAGPEAEAHWPMVFTKTGHPEAEHVPLLVPLEGCVAVRGEIVIENPRGKERRWVATEHYGRDCGLAPNEGTWDGQAR